MSWAPIGSHTIEPGLADRLLPPAWRVASRYVVAVLAVVVTLALKTLFPVVGELHPFVLLPVGIVVAAWYGGLGPGIAATIGFVIGTDLFFIPPIELGVNTDVAGLLALVVEGVILSWITVGLRHGRDRAHAAALAADQASREAALGLHMREELMTLWAAKLRGPLSDFVTTIDEGRSAHRERDYARIGLALEQLRTSAGLMRRTIEHWQEREEREQRD